MHAYTGHVRQWSWHCAGGHHLHYAGGIHYVVQLHVAPEESQAVSKPTAAQGEAKINAALIRAHLPPTATILLSYFVAVTVAVAAALCPLGLQDGWHTAPFSSVC